jgi:hypothetical protein
MENIHVHRGIMLHNNENLLCAGSYLRSMFCGEKGGGGAGVVKAKGRFDLSQSGICTTSFIYIY